VRQISTPSLNVMIFTDQSFMKRKENRKKKVSYNVKMLYVFDIPRKNKKSGIQQPSLPKDLNDMKVITS
jgi:hypothetical protein